MVFCSCTVGPDHPLVVGHVYKKCIISAEFGLPVILHVRAVTCVIYIF